MSKENIKALSEKEKVRKRISVWLGASNHIAVFHTLKELLGNSMDEISKGKGTKIEVIRHNEKKITVKDNCKGLPLEGKNDEGVENYKLLLEQLFAGTKYDNGIENEDYQIGINGVGLTTTVYASKDIYIEVGRPNGNIYSISYHKGDLVSPLKIIGKTKETYTSITYELDDEIFEENYFTDEEISLLSEEQSSLIDGEITFKDEVTGKENVFDVKDISHLLDLRAKEESAIGQKIEFNHESSFTVPKTHDEDEGKTVDKVKMDVVIQFSKEDAGVQIEFLNSSNLLHHGTIQDGLYAGMRNIFNRYLKGINAYNKKETQITKDDVSIGMNYIIDFKSFFPVYANQTKFASYVKYYETVVREALDNFFVTYELENKNNMDIIAKNILINKRSREKAESTRLNVKKNLDSKVNNVTARVDGFISCSSKDITKREYYIVEGKSALGSIQQGRDSKTQAIQAIRGKILNCLKSGYDRILTNEIIMDIYKVLGCGMEIKDKKIKNVVKFNIDELKWDKIIIATDADVDGYHIRTLLLTMFYVLSPKLIEEGKVFIAESPLYEILLKGDKSVFAYNDAEKDAIMKKEGKNVLALQRSKGLGENTPEMMAETTMNPDTRKLIQVLPTDVEKTLEKFELFLGSDVKPRKEYIEENLEDYIGLVD